MQFVKPVSGKLRQISMVPLVDVVFILLLFFMLTSSLERRAQIDLRMPVQSQTDDEPIIRLLEIVSPEGLMEVDDQLIDSRDASQLQDLLQDDADANFVVDTTDSIRAQTLVSVLDRLRDAGFARVSVRIDIE